MDHQREEDKGNVHANQLLSGLSQIYKKSR